MNNKATFETKDTIILRRISGKTLLYSEVKIYEKQGRQYKQLGYATKERMERAYKLNDKRQSCQR